MRSAVITTVWGRHGHLLAQRAALRGGSTVPDLHVVVAMGDPAVEALLRPDDRHAGGPRTVVVNVDVEADGLPLAAARNAGAAAALAHGAAVLIFLDVDCLAGPTLVGDYVRAATQRPHTVLCGPVTYLPPAPPGGWAAAALPAHRAPHPARPDPVPGRVTDADPALFWSLSFAVGAAAWSAIGGFDEGYVGYGAEDTDFARRAVAAGVAIGWLGGADAFHQHHATSSPPVQHLDAILRNGARYAARWQEWPMPGWLAEFERLGLVRREQGTWRRADPVRIATVPARHPYLDAVRPRGVRPVLADRVAGWEPDPLLDPSYLARHAADIDVVHLHFGYEHLDQRALDAWLAHLRRLGIALVLTVHDLRNPHAADRRRHDGHLRSLTAAADELITLTPGAADEVLARFGRVAQVVAHPTLVDRIPSVEPAGERVALVVLKSLRRNVVEPDAVVRAVLAGAERAGGRVRVDLRPEAVADPAVTGVRRLAEAGRLDLAVHERVGHDELVADLARAHAVVLPYRFGTHSGWVELAHDVGTRAVVPSCGYFADQWPGVRTYVSDERRGLDAESLRSAVCAALTEARPEPADRSERLSRREVVRGVHEIAYRASWRAKRRRRPCGTW